ncbi:MAG: penicillin-binding transpeptidase domain-containing protein [Planctomycetota bacterium]|nr:penicillin-binding transpeptidase domain-containing protein [Planctomycetota bacterium]
MEVSGAEKFKTLWIFSMFGLAAVALVVRLGWLQGTRAEPNRKAVELARDLRDSVPAIRGAIVDRVGRKLAYDRTVLTVQAEFHGRVAKGVERIPDRQLDYLATRLAALLMADEGRADRHDPSVRVKERERLARRIKTRRQRVLPSNYKTKAYIKIDFMLARALDSLTVVSKLCAEARHWNSNSDMPGRLYLRFVRDYRRTYPDRESTYGPIGNHYIARQTPVRIGQRTSLVPQEEFTGLESCRGLWPGSDGESFFHLDYRDARRHRYWSGLGHEPEPPSILHTTLDLELQKAAHQELRAASEAVRARYKSDYQWGSLVLIDAQSGDVLAMASHFPGRPVPTPFAAIESSFEPGSVVKPLVIAWAAESKRVRWDESIDCTPTHPKRGRVVGRIIYDDHACGVLSPVGIIVNSSNIGATQIGSRLDRAQWQQYFRLYGFCRKTAIGLPSEAAGGRPGGIAGIAKISDRGMKKYTGPSLSFGYELNVTAVQLARAYLTLLSGRQRELRLLASVSVNGKQTAAQPASQAAQRFLSEDTVARIKTAMTRVVSSEPHATGRHLYQMLEKLGHHEPLIAGKTGTSDSRIRGVRAKTAAFVGFAPVDTPRYLVVCVLRKDRCARFYGGSYAAPPAGRLLLRALALEGDGRRLQNEQVSAWSEDRGMASKE